ncbi:MAG: hypothetical protein CSA81_07555 [Acidobacteria bacterium]|nr:MAG: hypothetical protein CSA81_07555 [Acidobacteriota bacterium]
MKPFPLLVTFLKTYQKHALLFLVILTAAVFIIISAGETSTPGKTLSPGDCPLTAIEFEGPWQTVDFIINGRSIYQPIQKEIPIEEDRAVSVFQFMSENFHTWQAPRRCHYEKNYLYGLGYGMCGRESTIMTAIWHQEGIASRSIHWPHHVMAECDINGSPSLFDAQHGLDFNRLLPGRSGIRQFQENAFTLPEGYDPVGYSFAYLSEFYSDRNYEIIKEDKGLETPKISLATGQKAILRKRKSLACFPLPLPDGKVDDRTHLVPCYELHVIFKLAENENIELNIDLPFLGFIGSEEIQLTYFQSPGKRTRKTLNLNEASREFHATEGPLKLSFTKKSPEEESCTAVFLMAGWLGDRFFNMFSQENEFLSKNTGPGSIVLHRSPTTEKVWISSIELLTEPRIHKPTQVKVTVSWDHIQLDQPASFNLYLDSLTSKLPWDVWQRISRWTWTYNPKLHGMKGSESFEVCWVVTPNAGFYRPPLMRTLFGHVKGPFINSGQTGFQLDFTCLAGE